MLRQAASGAFAPGRRVTKKCPCYLVITSSWKPQGGPRDDGFRRGVASFGPSPRRQTGSSSYASRAMGEGRRPVWERRGGRRGSQRRKRWHQTALARHWPTGARLLKHFLQNNDSNPRHANARTTSLASTIPCIHYRPENTHPHPQRPANLARTHTRLHHLRRCTHRPHPPLTLVQALAVDPPVLSLARLFTLLTHQALRRAI